MQHLVENFLKKTSFHFLHLIPLVIIWCFFQGIFLYQYGIVTGLEATKYIDQAVHFLQTGKYTTGQFLFYSTQIWLLAFCIKTGAGYGLAVGVQIVLNGISAICFYKLALSLTGRRLAFAGTLYFLGLYYYHLYNVYLFTESLYFSFSVIYTFFLFRMPSLTAKSGAIILFFLALLYFTRPTGIFFIPATVVFIILKFYQKQSLKLFLGSAVFGLAGLFFLFNFSLNAGGELDFVLPYIDERVICGVPTIQGKNKILVPGVQNSIQGLWYIITHYRDLFLKLSLKRLGYFFGVIRPYYSFLHNLYIAFYFYIMYCLIIAGLRKTVRKFNPEVWFMLVIILLMTVTVMLSCDEWHNRFLLSLFPFFLFLSLLCLHLRETKVYDVERPVI